MFQFDDSENLLIFKDLHKVPQKLNSWNPNMQVHVLYYDNVHVLYYDNEYVCIDVKLLYILKHFILDKYIKLKIVNFKVGF